MKTPDDIWDDLGSLSEDELFHVLTKLHAVYEAQLKQNPGDEEARNFFQHLDNSITQTAECNSNRR